MINSKSKILELKGKTIALVYIFEKEPADGFDHFLIWKDKVLTGWLSAIYELNCLPYIMDVRTFMQKASCGTLPHIDYIINLNSGCNSLSTMGLVPSICSFLNIPCIPCDTNAILATENKKISNFIAIGANLQIPKFLDKHNNYGIYRPLNMGNSIGIEKKYFNNFNGDGIYQEFIPGYDVTIPIAYNFTTNKMDILPPTLYFPKNLDPNWIYDESIKETDAGLERLQFLEIENRTKDKLLSFLKIFDIKTYARIDARIKSKSNLSNALIDAPFSLEDCYFLEINSMPTVELDDGFDLAFKAILSKPDNSFYQCITEYLSTIKEPTVNGFLLACSMISLSTSKY